MSIQFGRWNFDGKPVGRHYLEKVSSLIAPYGPDGAGSYEKDCTSLLYRAFHTNKEACTETQPHVSTSGVVITWDGRLDNRAELAVQLADETTLASTDVAIVAAAYARWGKSCLSKLIGDWAMAIWNPVTRSVLLAKDFIGVRSLYYFFDNRHVTWSTILDPLVILADKTPSVEEEYIAGWVSAYPASHLTPYVGIYSVPPSSAVEISRGKLSVSKYWDFDPGKRIHYDGDAEYERHFRMLFAQSVRRRLRCHTPVLSELSGGMDSSSIVCTADNIIAEGTADSPRLDTVSYFNDSEPNWNERPYFAEVETLRGRTGCHIFVDSQNRFRPGYEKDRFRATPSSNKRRTESTFRFVECLNANGNRVLLRGIGGDEVLGGVSTPVPELADLLIAARPRLFANRLILWSLAKRKPVWHLVADTLGAFLFSEMSRLPSAQRPDLWLLPKFTARHREALDGYEPRLKALGSRPSFQANLTTVDALRRQISTSILPPEPLLEIRYPYLDRDLLEFLYAIPREQLVRPHQRRSLMRRALAGIVPDGIVNRRTKAFIARLPVVALSEEWTGLSYSLKDMITEELGIVDRKAFLSAMERARRGLAVPMVSLICTLQIEFWLRQIIESKFLVASTSVPLKPRMLTRSREPQTTGVTT